MLNERSRTNLKGVKPALLSVIEEASNHCEFVITEGLRSVERQRQLVAEGKSQTMNSRHLTGDAVDIFPGSWGVEAFIPVLREIHKAGQKLGVQLRFGCNWSSNPDDKTTSKFKDYPHVELSK